jgi:hypothetical protein
MELQANEALVNVTWAGQNGDMPQPVEFDASNQDILSWVTEAVQSGSIPGITPDPDADFSDFVVEKMAATEVRPTNQVIIRPKTAFGDWVLGETREEWELRQARERREKQQTQTPKAEALEEKPVPKSVWERL